MVHRRARKRISIMLLVPFVACTGCVQSDTNGKVDQQGSARVGDERLAEADSLYLASEFLRARDIYDELSGNYSLTSSQRDSARTGYRKCVYDEIRVNGLLFEYVILRDTPGFPEFELRTNLPDGTMVDVRIRRPNGNLGGDELAIEGGKVTLGIFPRSMGLPQEGTYTLTAETKPLRDQPWEYHQLLDNLGDEIYELGWRHYHNPNFKEGWDHVFTSHRFQMPLHEDTLALKMRVFRALIACEDEAPESPAQTFECIRAIGQEYGLSKEEVLSIVDEGNRENWPVK